MIISTRWLCCVSFWQTLSVAFLQIIPWFGRCLQWKLWIRTMLMLDWRESEIVYSKNHCLLPLIEWCSVYCHVVDQVHAFEFPSFWFHWSAKKNNENNYREKSSVLTYCCLTSFSLIFILFSKSIFSLRRSLFNLNTNKSLHSGKEMDTILVVSMLCCHVQFDLLFSTRHSVTFPKV